MRIFIFAALVAVASAQCSPDDGTGQGTDGCTCGGDTCTTGNLFCLATGPATGKHCLASAACTDGQTASAACSCNGSGDACTATTGLKCDTSQAEGSRCVKPDCATGGSTNDVTGLVETTQSACKCNPADTPDDCAVGAFCYAAGTAGKRCLVKTLCDQTGGDQAVAADCACGSTETGDQCTSGQFCSLSATEGSRCAASAFTTTTAAPSTTAADGSTTAADGTTTAAASDGTTAASSATTVAASKNVSPEAAAKAAGAEFDSIADAVPDTVAAQAKLATPPAGIKVSADQKASAEVAGTGKDATLTVKATIDDGTRRLELSGDPRTKADKFFCKDVMGIPVKMCNSKYEDASRRLSPGRQLAEKAYAVTIKMKSKDTYVADVKAAAEKAQAKTTSSGASVFGIAVALGLVGLF